MPNKRGIVEVRIGETVNNCLFSFLPFIFPNGKFHHLERVQK